MGTTPGFGAIVGIGSTEFSANSGRSTLTLATQACSAAIADAGLKPNQIDGIVRCTDDVVLHNELVQTLGIKDLAFWGHTGLGGTAPCAMLGQALGAIASGQATTVLCFRSLNGRSGRRFGTGWNAALSTVGGEQQQRYDEFFLPYGLTTPGQMYALIARRHSIEHGTTAGQLGHIALACRRRANANPAAQMHARPLDMAEYLDARMIADPLRLFDYCLETDGACAVVVTALDRARGLPHPPAAIRAVAQASGPQPQAGRALPALMRDSITTFPSRYAAVRLYERAGITVEDIQVAQLYDCFTITVLVQLEDYGFCAPGDGGPLAESGALEPGGRIPINTAGGHLSEGYIHGMNHIVEAVRQIRGTSTTQIADVEHVLVTSGVPPVTSAAILGVDR